MNRLKSLTKEQKKIIYITLVTVVFFVLFWMFVYMPQSRKFSAIRKELTDAEGQISSIMTLVGKRSLAQAAKDMGEELATEEKLLPDGEEDVVYNLSQAAKKLKIDVKVVDPGNRTPTAHPISGYDIEELPVSLTLACEYKVLGEYLQELTGNFPILVKINQLEIRSNGEGIPILNVQLQLTAYLSKSR